MARQDINMDPVYGELNLTDNISGKRFYGFRLLDETATCCSGEIIIPADFKTKYRDSSGIHVHIPYTPVFKPLKIRFRIELLNGGVEYLTNETTNDVWFNVISENSDGVSEMIRMSELIQLNEDGNYNLIIKDGFLTPYSGDETDIVIKASLSQNEAFLLKASAGNLYQFPMTGVGLIDYLHGNFENSGLAQKLQQEFLGDNMIVINAYMDSTTGELLLEVRERTEQGEEQIPDQTDPDEPIEEIDGEI